MAFICTKVCNDKAASSNLAERLLKEGAAQVFLKGVIDNRDDPDMLKFGQQLTDFLMSPPPFPPFPSFLHPKPHSIEAPPTTTKSPPASPFFNKGILI
jgi:hypothetical protein